MPFGTNILFAFTQAPFFAVIPRADIYVSLIRADNFVVRIDSIVIDHNIADIFNADGFVGKSTVVDK